MTLLFLAALAGGVVLFVLFPIFARASEVSEKPSEASQERKSLGEKKDRIYEAIKDVDFEYQAGKLSDSDYQSVRADFVAQAAEVIARLDELDASHAAAEKEEPAVESPEPAPEAESGVSCPSCEQSNPEGAKFCMRCGHKIEISPNCPQCGAELQEEARFCTACGVSIPA